MRGGRDMFFGACSPLFDRVERGRSFVVVPHLAMAETIHVLRKLTTDEFKPTFVEAEDHVGIRAECRSIEEDLADYVDGLVENKNAEIAKYSSKLSRRHSRVLSKISAHSGRITGGLKSKYRYTGLGHADIEHAYPALYAKVSEFYSTDKAFDALNGDPEFASASFKVPS